MVENALSPNSDRGVVQKKEKKNNQFAVNNENDQIVQKKEKINQEDGKNQAFMKVVENGNKIKENLLKKNENVNKVGQKQANKSYQYLNSKYFFFFFFTNFKL